MSFMEKRANDALNVNGIYAPSSAVAATGILRLDADNGIQAIPSTASLSTSPSQLMALIGIGP